MLIDRDLDVDLLLDRGGELGQAVIWKPPSPATTQTSSSGRAILAPMAAGRAKPMVPRPPEVIRACSGAVGVVLGLPHLVLADVGDDDGSAAGELPQVVDDVGGLEHGRLEHLVEESRAADLVAPAVDAFDPVAVLDGPSAIDVRAFEGCLRSPTMPTSTWTFLSISEGSMSTWILRAWGA